MLFGFFRSVTRRAAAIPTASHIADAINVGSGGFFLKESQGEFLRRALLDEFVLSYIYGATCFAIQLVAEREEETIGYLVLEVYQRLFPGHGKDALTWCNMRLKEGNETFKHVSGVGYKEMKVVWDSPGVGLLSTLHNRLSNLQDEPP